MLGLQCMEQLCIELNCDDLSALFSFFKRLRCSEGGEMDVRRNQSMNQRLVLLAFL